MTIFDYISSDTVLKYSKRKGREPDSAELAWLIHEDGGMTLLEKHRLYDDVTALLSDREFNSGGIYDDGNVKSVHGFLSKYKELEKRLLVTFCIKEPNAVYTYKLRSRSEEGWIGEGGALYADFSEAIAEFEGDAELDPDFALFCKRYIGGDDKRIYVRMRPDGSILKVEEDRFLGEEEEYRLFYDVFYAMGLAFGHDAYSE